MSQPTGSGGIKATNLHSSLQGTLGIPNGVAGGLITNDTPSKTFLNYYFDSGATSGWTNGFYSKLLATGAGGSFTSLEGDMTISAQAVVATGIECFMALTGAGCVSGMATAVQGTIDFSSAVLAGSGGWYVGGTFNIKGEGANADLTTAQAIACIQLKTEGTFAATTKSFQEHARSYAIIVNGFTPAAGTGSILSSTSPAEFDLTAAGLGLRVGVNTGGTDTTLAAYYIPLIPAADWN